MILDALLSNLKDIALVVGGSWALWKYLKSRENMPRAVLEHQINHLKIADGFVMIYADLIIRNVGARILDVSELETQVQVISADESKIYFDEIKQGKFDNLRKPLPENLWISICSLSPSYCRHRNRFIEPSETDIVSYEFIIPESYDFVRLFSYFRNQNQKNNTWERQTIYRLQDKKEHIQ